MVEPDIRFLFYLPFLKIIAIEELASQGMSVLPFLLVDKCHPVDLHRIVRT